MTPYTNFQYGHWVAVDDETYFYIGDTMGIGRTEAEAIADLLDQLQEREERIAARRNA